MSDRLARARGKPRSIRVSNGPEFAGGLLEQWAYLNKVEFDFSRPGNPTDNAYIEAFNGKLHDEDLNETLFSSLAEAREKLEAWQGDYSDQRPPSVLGNLTPREFA